MTTRDPSEDDAVAEPEMAEPIVEASATDDAVVVDASAEAAPPDEAATSADAADAEAAIDPPPHSDVPADPQVGDAAADPSDTADAPQPPEPAVDRGIVEALLFAADEPLTPAHIKKALGRGDTGEIRAVLDAIRDELDERRAGFALVEVAGGYQFRTRPEYASWIRQLRSEKPARLSKPALETLAVVSYKQPITRAEIEAIRRVDTGAVLKTLLDRRLVKVVGTKDVPGRPVLYGTSREFLEVFRLKSLRELPTLKEIRDVAAEMGDALDVPGELLPEGLGAVLARDDASASEIAEGEVPVAAQDELDEGPDARNAAAPHIDMEEASGAPEDEPAPSPPSPAAEED